MTYDLAPMEGITTYIYRTTYAKYYGGIARYYTPFLASMHLSTREKNEVLPEHNAGITVIPQILSNRADEFLSIDGEDSRHKSIQKFPADFIIWERFLPAECFLYLFTIGSSVFLFLLVFF